MLSEVMKNMSAVDKSLALSQSVSRMVIVVKQCSDLSDM